MTYNKESVTPPPPPPLVIYLFWQGEQRAGLLDCPFNRASSHTVKRLFSINKHSESSASRLQEGCGGIAALLFPGDGAGLGKVSGMWA